MRGADLGLRPARTDICLTVLGVLVGLLLGLLGGYDGRLGLAAALGIAAVLAALLRPVVIAIVTLAGMFAVQRLGGTSATAGSSGGVSYSDALLAVGALAAVPGLLQRIELRRLWLPLAGLALYLTCLLPSVLLNATARGYQEWVHRVFLVGGALLVGAWITREHAIRPALRVLAAVGSSVALLAIIDTVTSGFAPAEPLGLNKNFAGAQLGALVVLFVVAGRRLEVSPRLRSLVVVLLTAGLLASQSRGAMLAAAVGLLVPFVLDPRAHSRGSKLVVAVVAAALGLFLYFSITDELHQTQQNLSNSSFGVRVNVERETRSIWHTSPIYGVGLKYFNSGDYSYYAQAANNDVDNELAESGLIGLAGFLTLQLSVVLAGFRRGRGNTLVVAGVAMVLAQMVHGLFDIYWTAGVVPLPFIILGMALATAPNHPPLERSSRPANQPVGKMIRSAAARTRSTSNGSAAEVAIAPIDTR